MSPCNRSFAVSIPHTFRAVGLYALVDGALFFAPRDLVDDLVARFLRRSDGTYCQARTTVYKACAALPGILDITADTETNVGLPERLVRLRSMADALAHERALRDSFAMHGAPALQREHRAVADAEPVHWAAELVRRPPSAVGPGCPIGFTVCRDHEAHIVGADGCAARVQVREVIHRLGTYVSVDGVLHFAPTRALGDMLVRRRHAGGLATLDGVLATVSAYAGIAQSFDENAAPLTTVPFSRRIARFSSPDAAIAHRTRLAAIHLLPASPTFTRRHERQFHFVSTAQHCDQFLRAD